MSSEPHPSADAAVILFLDANMPDVLGCRHDGLCADDASRLCRHRFNPEIWVVAKSHEKRMMRMKDLGVVCEFFAEIRRHWTATERSVGRRYVLATHDKTFIASASHEYRGPHACGMYPLAFAIDDARGNGRIRSGEEPFAVSVEVLVVPGGFHDRDRDLRTALEHCRSLSVLR